MSLQPDEASPERLARSLGMPADAMGDTGLITLAVLLRMPEGSEIARLWSEQPARKGAEIRVYFERARPGAYTLHTFTVPDPASEPVRGFTTKPIEGFTFEVVGRIVAAPARPWTWRLSPTGGLTDAVALEAWWMAVPISPSLRAVRDYDPLSGTSRSTLERTGPEWELEWRAAGARPLRAWRALDWTLTKPGPKAGQVKAQKYKTPDQWRAAIREKVLPRNRLPTATGRQVARWLGISRPLLYKRMRDWGPPSSLEDLKAGNF